MAHADYVDYICSFDGVTRVIKCVHDAHEYSIVDDRRMFGLPSARGLSHR